jgi:hypothetical protein
MLASHDFQESLKNYFDLAELQRKLTHWADYIGAFEEMIKIREAYYEPLLPPIEAKFRVLDSKMKLRVEQRDHLDKRLKKMLVAPRPDFLAKVGERRTLMLLDNMKKRLGNNADPRTLARIDRLEGVISWRIDTQYQDRFSKANKHLHELDADVDKLRKIYHSFVRTRQAATQSYKGYNTELNQLRIKIRNAREKIKVLMARQGHLIEVMALNELELRRKRLEQYQVKARFAMAENYDRATKAQQEQVINKEEKARKAKQKQEQEQQKQQKQQKSQENKQDAGEQEKSGAGAATQDKDKSEQ